MNHFYYDFDSKSIKYDEEKGYLSYHTVLKHALYVNADILTANITEIIKESLPNITNNELTVEIVRTILRSPDYGLANIINLKEDCDVEEILIKNIDKLSNEEKPKLAFIHSGKNLGSKYKNDFKEK